MSDLPRRQARGVTRPAAADGSGTEGVVADRIVVVLLVVLRAGTLFLGAAEISGSSGVPHPGVGVAVLAGLAGQSTLMFGLAAVRLRRGVTPALGELTALVEMAAAVTGLLTVAYATPLSLRTTSTFWIEPYTVISVVVLAAAARRRIVGAAGAACLTATYLLCVFVVAPEGMRLSSAATATAWTNAISYLPFFVIGAIGFALVRSVVEKTDTLRRELVQLSKERARVTVGSHAYDIGHNNPKAVLREVRHGIRGMAELRPWVEKSREDLLTAFTRDEREPVTLRDELTALAGAVASAITLRLDLEEIDEVPASAPTLLIAEAVRELLNNVSHHAFGFPATLAGRSTAEFVQIAVHNDGPGLDPVRLAFTWALKQNTLHQLEAAGGSYEIHSSANSSAGITVTVTWPAAGTRGTSAPGTCPACASGSWDDTSGHTRAAG